jgi:hypothetical protein
MATLVGIERKCGDLPLGDRGDEAGPVSVPILKKMPGCAEN